MNSDFRNLLTFIFTYKMEQPGTIEERKAKLKDQNYVKKMKKENLKLCEDSNSLGTGIQGCYFWLEKDQFPGRKQCRDCFNKNAREKAPKFKEQITELKEQIETISLQLEEETKRNKRLNKRIETLEEDNAKLKEDIEIHKEIDKDKLIERIRDLEKETTDKDDIINIQSKEIVKLETKLEKSLN